MPLQSCSAYLERVGRLDGGNFVVDVLKIGRRGNFHLKRFEGEGSVEFIFRGALIVNN
mgnify:CR=1 FL=1